MMGFWFSLVYFGGGGEGTESGGGFSGINEGGVVSNRCDVRGVAETATAKDAVYFEGVKGSLGV